ncbi:uncharacterized protein KZ484_013092 [Pholidichthys leucotaenia]
MTDVHWKFNYSLRVSSSEALDSEEKKTQMRNTMAEFRWIHMSLCLILISQAKASTKETSVMTKVGDDVTLPCGKLIDGQTKCNGTTWSFRGSETLVELIKLGENAKNNSDIRSVTKNCSLVIKKVKVEEAGSYYCHQYRLKERQAVHELLVHLSVINMTEHKDTNKDVKLSCAVFRYGDCHHTVKWLNNGNPVDENNKQLQPLNRGCSATMSVPEPHFIYSNLHLLTCEVTDEKTKAVKKFPVGSQPSDGKTDKPKGYNNTTPATDTKSNSTAGNIWAPIVIVAVVLVMFLITVVVIIRYKRSKGDKAQVDNTGFRLSPAMTVSAPDHDQSLADPEISYATINYTSKTNNKALARNKDDDDEAVTYSMVKSPSAGATADPSQLYAAVNHPN